VFPEASYRPQTPATDPGREQAAYHVLPPDVRELQQLLPGLVIHLNMEHIYGYKPSSQRRAEASLRRVELMLGRLFEVDGRPLNERREIERRLVGDCRQSTVLICSMLRHTGTSARARAGFSTYFGPFRGDHWVAEYWSDEAKRWLLVDAELDETLMAASNIDFDPCNVPRNQWLSAAEVWLACRTGGDDESRYGLDPSVTGLPYIAAQLLRDLAALRRLEVGPRDRWGVASPGKEHSAADYRLLDDLATALISNDDGQTAAQLFLDERLRIDQLPPDDPLPAFS
jgi:hypothetical protein